MTITATRAQTTEAAAVFATQPDVNAVAFWTNGLSTCQWPQATVDNRHDRVLARVRNILGLDPTDLVVVHRPAA